MKILVPILLAIILGRSSGAASVVPKVAVIYSAWSDNAFRGEFDGHLQSMGWSFEDFENRDVAKLIARLDEFDMVVSAGVGNYTNPQDMTKYNVDWMKFVNRGGAILITDASYDSVLNMWVGGLKPAMALTSRQCLLMSDSTGFARVRFVTSDPLLSVPRDLMGPLRKKQGVWAHLDTWGSDWRSLIDCPDGKSLMLSSDIGKGSILVTSFFSFKGETATQAAIALLDNLWTHVQGLRSGIALTSVDFGKPLPGEQTAVVALCNNGAAINYVNATLHLDYGDGKPIKIGPVSETVKARTTTRLKLPYTVDRRGPIKLSIEIASGSELLLKVDNTEAIPPVMEVNLKERHLDPPVKQLGLHCAFTPDANAPLAESTVQIMVNGKLVERISSPKSVEEVGVRLPSLPNGKHTVSVELIHGGSVVGESTQEFYTHSNPVVKVLPNGTLSITGKPFFPFGWYHVSWGFTAEQRLAFLRDIHAGGFNTVHVGVKKDDDWGLFLNEAQKLNVKVITEFGVEPIAVIKQYRSHPAVLAWNPGDEPDGAGIPPEEMLRRFDNYRIADPDHPVYMTLCVPATYGNYANCADILAPDPYPIATAPISLVYKSLSSAVAEADKHKHTVIGILQCFGYANGPWRVPTFAECRNMTYQALLAGVKGIIYYTYADGQFLLTDHPELWKQMQTLPSEINALAPFLTNGKLTKLETGNPDMVAGVWTYGRKAVVCVVNTSGKGVQTVNIALPGDLKGVAKKILPNQSVELSVTNGKVTGALETMGVEVFEIDGR